MRNILVKDLLLSSFTCKSVTDVEPGVSSVGMTRGDTVLLQVFLQVPAFSFIKCVEEQGELLDITLPVQSCLKGPGFANN